MGKNDGSGSPLNQCGSTTPSESAWDPHPGRYCHIYIYITCGPHLFCPDLDQGRNVYSAASKTLFRNFLPPVLRKVSHYAESYYVFTSF
jgi:hypothetical protein